MDTHAFKPSRPNGVVCVSDRSDPDDTRGANLCGYPPGHPIHETELAERDCTHGDGCPVHPDTHAVHNFDANTPAEARTGISDRNAAALQGVANLRYRLKADRVDWTPELDCIERALRGEL